VETYKKRRDNKLFRNFSFCFCSEYAVYIHARVVTFVYFARQTLMLLIMNHPIVHTHSVYDGKLDVQSKRLHDFEGCDMNEAKKG
jgi:hypothetical protein